MGLCCGQFAGSTEDSALNEEDITWGAIAQAEVNDAVEGALAAGVNFFDTAEVYPPPPLAVHRTAPLTVGTDWWWGQAYGGGQAEQALGTALKTLGTKREDVVIASKFGKHPALWETSVPPPTHPTPLTRKLWHLDRLWCQSQ